MTLLHTLKLIFVGPDPKDDRSDQLTVSEVVLQKDEIDDNKLPKAQVPTTKTQKRTVSPTYAGRQSKSKLKVDPSINAKKTATKPKTTAKPKPVVKNTSKAVTTNDVKLRKPAALSVKDENVLNTTIDPKVYFNQYAKIIDNLQKANKGAAVEMMSAQKDMRTKNFIDRSIADADKQANKLKTKKAKINYIEKRVEEIRKFNKQLSVDARAHLAIVKKEKLKLIEGK